MNTDKIRLFLLCIAWSTAIINIIFGQSALVLANAGVLSLSFFFVLTFSHLKKGTIAVGTDADIVIFDPNRKETISVNNPCTHHMRVDYSAYEGFEVQGFTETVLSRGRVIIENNEQKIERGGQFIKRALVNSHLN